MSDWTGGYVSDIEYMPGFYVDQTPAHLDAVCLLRATEPPVEPGSPFRYCELGCGLGETALAIAAANIQSEVWAFDFNPAHIAHGRRLAEAGGLRNIHLEEASFEHLASSDSADIPLFDYIALHGVWSWVSVENRAHIVRFIDRHLKPGGLVYVTYNALPGWTPALPAQRLMWMLSGFETGRSDKRMVTALDKLRQLSEAGAKHVPAEHLDRLEKERERGNLAYLSHEYMNRHWNPCYHADVALDLLEAKLSFVGSANIFENFPDLSLTREQRDVVGSIPANGTETVKDFFLERTFRRDVFIRGPRRIPDRRLEQRLRERKLALVVPATAISRDIKIPLGSAALSEGFYKPAFEALIEGPHTIGELMDLPAAQGSTATPREVIGMMIGSRQAMAIANQPCAAAAKVTRDYNAAYLRFCADEGRSICALAGAAIGSAVTATLFEMLAYEALAAGTPPEPEALTNAAWQMLLDRGDKLRHQGELIEDPQKNIDILRENMELIVTIALPIWKRVGAI